MKYQFVILPSDELAVSPGNPRRSMNDEALKDLAASIEEIGIINPLTVRNNNNPAIDKCYEIISGERRFKAALMAGLDQLPCIIKDVTDDEVLEIQILENLQREDVNPIDEAHGFKRMLDSGRYGVAEIAKRMGKGEMYVYNRLKLIDLLPELQEHVLTGYLSLGHGILLAKLTAENQLKAFGFIARAYGDDLKDEPDTVKELQSCIKRFFMMNIADAPFDVNDPELTEDAAACHHCSKRTGVNEMLFPELQSGDKCTDPGCWKAKREAHIRKAFEKETKKYKTIVKITDQKWMPNTPENKGVLSAPDWTESKKGICKDTKRGVYIDDEKLGEGKWVCVNEKCEIHWAQEADYDGFARDDDDESENAAVDVRAGVSDDYSYWREMRRLKIEKRVKTMTTVLKYLATENYDIKKVFSDEEWDRFVLVQIFSKLHYSQEETICKILGIITERDDEFEPNEELFKYYLGTSEDWQEDYFLLLFIEYLHITNWEYCSDKNDKIEAERLKLLLTFFLNINMNLNEYEPENDYNGRLMELSGDIFSSFENYHTEIKDIEKDVEAKQIELAEAFMARHGRLPEVDE